MTFALLILFILISVGEGILLLRAARRLLEFDSIFENIAPVLDSYGEDLKKTVSSGLLEDHPEVVAFHQRNARAMQAIDSIAESVKATRPRKKPKLPKNHRPPVVE